MAQRSLRSCKRILLKLSGEILSGGQPFGVDLQACSVLAQSIKTLHSQGLEIGIVIGGGNIFRGFVLKDMGYVQTPADQVGMLATLMNGIVLQQALEQAGCPCKLLSALECPRVAETFTWRAAMDYIDHKNVVIFVGGTGNPYFTTDTAAALRAGEIGASVLIKATKVDGVYSQDPKKHPDAKRFETLSYAQMIADDLQVMDATSVTMCAKNKIPIYVCNMAPLQTGKPLDLLDQKPTGTWIS